MNTGQRVRVLEGVAFAGERGTVAGRLAADADKGEARSRGWIVPVQLDRHPPGCLTGFRAEHLALEPLPGP